LCATGNRAALFDNTYFQIGLNQMVWMEVFIPSDLFVSPAKVAVQFVDFPGFPPVPE